MTGVKYDWHHWTELGPGICIKMPKKVWYKYIMLLLVQGPVKANQSDSLIDSPIFSKYWTGHCPMIPHNHS